MAIIHFTLTKLKNLDPAHVARVDIQENSKTTAAYFPEVGERYICVVNDQLIGTSVVQKVEHLPDNSIEFETLNSRYRMVIDRIEEPKPVELPAYAGNAAEAKDS